MLFKHEDSTLEITQLGSGSKILWVFPGFGQSNAEVEHEVKFLGEAYTIFVFAPFFHEKSVLDVKGNAPLSKEELATVFKQFSESQNHTRVSILAYSLGGRIALTLIESCPEIINNVYLFAPDGVVNSFWYYFANLSAANRRVFRWFMSNPNFIHSTTGVLHRAKLLRSSTTKLVRMNTGSLEKGMQVYNTWTAYRAISPIVDNVKQQVIENKIPVKLVFGKYDKVIPVSYGEKLSDETEGLVELHIVDKGHNLFVEVVLKEIIA